MPVTNLSDKVVWQNPHDLIPYANSPIIHTKGQIKKLRHSLRHFGWATALIIDEQLRILCGAGRHQAAIEEGMLSVPTLTLSGMSEEDRIAYIIADNVLARKASLSKALLKQELQGLIDVGYDVEITGLDTIEIDTALSIETDASTEREDLVDLPSPETPVSRLGDLWHIGDHKLLVGDARDGPAYELLLQGQRAQLVLTDPPYGCEIENNVSGLGRVKHSNFVAGAGETSLPEFAQTLLRPAFKLIARHSMSGAIGFVFCDWRAAPHLLDAALGVFAEVKNMIVWSKTNAGMGSFYRSGHELIYAFKVNPGKHINNFGLGEGGRHRSNVWVYAGANTFRKGREQDLHDHPTVKPKKLCADAILDCSRRNGIVLDPFAGSGATLVAAAMTGRRGYGIELDPKYADVTLRRLAEEVGEPARLDGGITFDEVAEERRGGGAS